MKITQVDTLHLRLPDVAEIADGTQDVLVVCLHTDDGLTGIGEVTSQSYVCQACFDAPRSAERRHGLRHLLIGQTIDDPARLWKHLYHHTNRYGRRGAAIHALSGADIAVWDLFGKAQGQLRQRTARRPATHRGSRLRQLSFRRHSQGHRCARHRGRRPWPHRRQVRMGAVW